MENAVGYVKKNFLAGLRDPGFCRPRPGRPKLARDGRQCAHPWRDPQKARCALRSRAALPSAAADKRFDIATVSPQRASTQFRITLDTNRYSVPAEYAGRRLTVKTDPERICVYAADKLIARHIRSYDRHQDFEDPDHPKALLAQRKKARDQKIFMRFLSLSPRADLYYRKLARAPHEPPAARAQDRRLKRNLRH